jgi:hypothetical protein
LDLRLDVAESDRSPLAAWHNLGVSALLNTISEKCFF